MAVAEREHAAVEVVDLETTPLRELNQRLHDLAAGKPGPRHWRVVNPSGAHAVACGLDAEIDVEIDGHVGYYCAGMNKLATVRVHGNASTGIAENMMSGRVEVDGNVSQSAGATGRGGLLVVRGTASSRCGISMKGIDIVVGGSVGHMSAFMAQTGCLVVCGDAGEALGDSIYEARLYVRGSVASLGADCIEKELRDEHRAQLAGLLDAAEIDADPAEFRRYGSARQLYNFSIDNAARLLMSTTERPWNLRESYLFDRAAIAEIQRAATEGIYDIRGFGAKRRLPHFDDLLFLGASISRYPLEGYRERCATDVVLGTRFAQKPLELKIPVTIAGMSFGALSAPAKEALGRGATEVGTSTTTGDGGMTPEEREHSKTLVYQLLPSRYGMNPDDLRRCDAIEVVVGQGAKPGGGGMLLGHKISDRVAEMRSLPKGIDQRSASRHPDWTGPDDLEIKINELREITDWEKPVFVKVGATRTYYDVQLAVKAGADVIVVDGMQGGTAATQDIFIEHVGIPTLPATRIAADALQELGMHRQVQLIVSGGIRNGADVAKALALGADAVSIGTAALVAMGDNSPEHDEAYREIGSAAGFYDDWQAGRDPTGISTQDDELAARFDPILGGRRIANYLRVLTLETQTLARACGKSHVHNLEPEDLVALTVEAAAMAKVPLAGTDWIPGAGS